MLDRPLSKKQRPALDMSPLSADDRLAFERVAALLHKPLSELYEENPRNPSIGAGEFGPTGDDMYNNPQSWLAPTAPWETLDGWQQEISYDEIDNCTSHPNRAWTRPSGTILEEESPVNVTCNQWTEGKNQTPAINLGDREGNGYSDISNQVGAVCRRSPSWSHTATVDEPWVSVPTVFVAQTSLHEGMTENPERASISKGTGGQRPAKGSSTPTQEHPSPSHVRGPGEDREAMERAASRRSPSTCSDLFNGDEREPQLELDWEELDREQVPCSGSQLVSPAATTESARTYEHFEETSLADNPNVNLTKWVSVYSNAKELSAQKPQRRAPFVDQQLREETSSTRKLKACVRCRMQKIRCQINNNDPSGICQTCQAVSKQKIHTLPCVRYKLTECTIYRTGKAPGLEFTFRWPVMKLRDISEWSDPDVRTIQVVSDVCPIPLELSVRKFVPIPQDSLHKSWMDGKTKKFKETTPYAIVNMSAAVKDMREYINKHIFECMAYWLVGRDAWVQETYRFARKYMTVAPPEEASLLGDLFRLWFAVRRTATVEFIVGDETLEMAPETTDRSYPLFGKVPLPPVMIQQLDMIVTIGLLQPLRKKFLEDFQRIVLANKPKSWMTIYLITFICLHGCAATSAENYKNARKHGLKRRYAMPNFMSERHHSANVFLSHYHYCTKPCSPFTVDWRTRQTTPFAEMTTDEILFLIKTSDMVKERQDRIRIAREIGLYEDDLYFLSQMFEEDWMPRDSVIDYSDETITRAPLKRF